MLNNDHIQQALQAEPAFNERIKQKIELTMKASQATIVALRRSESFVKAKEIYPTAYLIWEILANAAAKEDFKEEKLKHLGILSLNMNFSDEEDISSITECVHWTNAYGFKDVKAQTLIPFAMGTESGIKDAAKIDVTKISSTDAAVITDVQEARHVVCDYIYQHPNPDTESDVVFILAIVFDAIGALFERGYVLTGYDYSVNYNGTIDKKELGPIALEFTPNNDTSNMQKIYLHHDYEAALQSVNFYEKKLLEE